MKKHKVFIACDTTKISQIKKIIKNTKNNKINIGYKFGLEFLNSKKRKKIYFKFKKSNYIWRL